MVAFAENKILKGGACRPTGDTTILNADFSTPPAGTQPISDYLYQGMTLDAVTGLYYERNRNYSPSLAVWTSQDPAGYVNGANTYQFIESNPVDETDAAGLKFVIVAAGPNPAAPSAATIQKYRNWAKTMAKEVAGIPSAQFSAMVDHGKVTLAGAKFRGTKAALVADLKREEQS